MVIASLQDILPIEVTVARVPLRMFGLFLLIVSLSVASCQALVHSLAPVDAASDPPARHPRRVARLMDDLLRKGRAWAPVLKAAALFVLPMPLTIAVLLALISGDMPS